jgi:hypothetical protein
MIRMEAELELRERLQAFVDRVRKMATPLGNVPAKWVAEEIGEMLHPCPYKDALRRIREAAAKATPMDVHGVAVQAVTSNWLIDTVNRVLGDAVQIEAPGRWHRPFDASSAGAGGT